MCFEIRCAATGDKHKIKDSPPFLPFASDHLERALSTCHESDTWTWFVFLPAIDVQEFTRKEGVGIGGYAPVVEPQIITTGISSRESHIPSMMNLTTYACSITCTIYKVNYSTSSASYSVELYFVKMRPFGDISRGCRVFFLYR